MRAPMNLFPSDEFRDQILRAPWYNIDNKAGSSTYHLKAVCMVSCGCGVVVTNFIDAWVGYLSLQALRSQLQRRMPGISIEPVEALRMVERCVLEGNGARFSLANQHSAIAEFESALDLGLDNRSVPLRISINVDLFQVSSVGEQSGNTTSEFIKVVVIEPLFRTLRGSSLLCDHYRGEAIRLGGRPAPPNEALARADCKETLGRPIDATVTSEATIKAIMDASNSFAKSEEYKAQEPDDVAPLTALPPPQPQPKPPRDPKLSTRSTSYVESPEEIAQKNRLKAQLERRRYDRPEDNGAPSTAGARQPNDEKLKKIRKVLL